MNSTVLLRAASIVSGLTFLIHATAVMFSGIARRGHPVLLRLPGGYACALIALPGRGGVLFEQTDRGIRPLPPQNETAARLTTGRRMYPFGLRVNQGRLRITA